MDKRSARRKGPAITRLDAEIDSIAGRSTYGNGQRVYGARRIQAQRRAAVTQLLRGELGVPVQSERTTEKLSVSADLQAKLDAQRTTRRRVPLDRRIARVVGIVGLILSAIGFIGIEGGVFGMLASGPAPLLWRVTFGRAS